MFNGFQHAIAGGQGNLIVTALQSPNFQHLVQGWQIARDGSAEFNDLTIRGVFDGTDFEINSSGIFFYSPTVGPGNLFYSIASASGTDKYGNPYKRGGMVYGPNSSGVQLATASTGNPTVFFYPQSASSLQGTPQIYSSTLRPGAPNEGNQLAIVGGSESAPATPNSVGITFNSGSADNTFIGNVLIFGNNPSYTPMFGFVPTQYASTVYNCYMLSYGVILALDPATTSTPETWHNIQPDSGWTVTTQQPQIRMLPDGNVQLRGVASHASFTTVGNLNLSTPVPAQYRPSIIRNYRPGDPTVSAGLVAMQPSGVIQVRASSTYPTTQVILDGVYSL